MEATIVEEASFAHKKKKKFVCTKCQSWVDASMSWVSVEHIYNEKTGSEEVAGELHNALDDFDPNRWQNEPMLDVGEMNGL